MVREVQEPGGLAWQPLVNAFGKDIVLENPTRLNRAALGERVFGDSPAHRMAMRRLNALMRMPILRQFLRTIVTAIFVSGAKFLVLDIPLLFERGFQRICSETVCNSSKAAVAVVATHCPGHTVSCDCGLCCVVAGGGVRQSAAPD